MATEITKEYNNEYHVNTVKETLDYLHTIRLNSPYESSQLDGMIHDLTKVVRLIKGLNPKEMSDYERSQLPDDDDRKINL
jgi:hypothetical protein